MFISRPIKIKIIVLLFAAVLAFATVAFFKINKQPVKLLDFAAEAKNLQEQCAQDAQKQNCYRQKFSKLALENGFEFASQTLKELQLLDSQPRQCHGLAHIISIAAVKRDPNSWQQLIKKADISMEGCAGGFLHGIVEGHLAFDSSFTINAQSLTQTCGSLPKLTSTACAHGFGHMLIFQTEDDIEKAAAVCGQVGPLAFECYNGMFMENAFKDMLFEHGLITNHPNPTKDAQSFAQVKKQCENFKNNLEASEACWSNLGHIIAEYYQYDQKQVYSACQKAPHKAQARLCYFRAISSLVISEKFSPTAEKLSLCTPYAEDLKAYSKCARYVAATLIYHSTTYAQKTADYCLGLLYEAQEGCFKAVGFMLSQRLDAKNLQTACENFPKNYLHLCLTPKPDEDIFSAF